MKAFWVAAWLMITALPAMAQDYTIRDAAGKRVETVEKSYGDRWIRRDATGRRIGTVEKSYGDRMILRDASGKRIGTVEESYGGRKTVRDNNYRTLYRI
ncbi:MAG: hypothetical protein AB7H77_03585, partial [Bdellovibrionales bacterium]